MPIEDIRIPSIENLKDFKVSKWHVREGQKIVAGDIIAELESDKATIDLEVFSNGKIHLIAEAGAVQESGQIIAKIACTIEEYDQVSKEIKIINTSTAFDARDIAKLDQCRSLLSREEFLSNLLKQALQEYAE
ncbi:lipoyl domain-containing protein [Cerasicoccus frondis]|uniref:lipoyl domain-containing protein n=1 Tax=Cerasicoccus frondis TaxID=490090 RepID=UPI00285261AC|nr:lipoyl domain-containing protein [Cerasicoccus frondis]